MWFSIVMLVYRRVYMFMTIYEFRLHNGQQKQVRTEVSFTKVHKTTSICFRLAKQGFIGGFTKWNIYWLSIADQISEICSWNWHSSGFLEMGLPENIAYTFPKPICSIVLEYLPTFAQTKSLSFVGKYTSTMEHMGNEKRTHMFLFSNFKSSNCRIVSSNVPVSVRKMCLRMQAAATLRCLPRRQYLEASKWGLPSVAMGNWRFKWWFHQQNWSQLWVKHGITAFWFSTGYPSGFTWWVTSPFQQNNQQFHPSVSG